MARERYLLEDTEDTIHQNPITPTTGKEKRQNWWFYHKVHLIVGIIAVRPRSSGRSSRRRTRIITSRL